MHRSLRAANEKEAPVGSIVGAVLGLVAFMLAITFGNAASHFDSRKQLVLAEANAIGTTYLRAGLLPESQRAEIRSLLREYVAVRIKAPRVETVEHAVAESEELQDRLWLKAAALSANNPGAITYGLLIQSLNELIDLHAKRVTIGLRSRIPGHIWATLYFVTVVSMSALGYHIGLTRTRSPFAVIALTLAFSAVILVIADLDRSQKGLITVSQQALVDLQTKIGKPGPELRE
jgi:hypothetical protein